MTPHPLPWLLNQARDFAAEFRAERDRAAEFAHQREIRRLSPADLLPMAGTCPWCGGEVGWCPTPVPDGWKEVE